MAEGKRQLLAIEGCGLWQAQAGRSQPRLRVAVAVAVTVTESVTVFVSRYLQRRFDWSFEFKDARSFCI